MLAGPTSTVATMRRALSYTIAALNVASRVDIDRNSEDHAFFAAQRDKLVPLAAELKTADIAIQDFDLGPRTEHQAAVELGDQVLDRGVRAANTRTKLELRGPTTGLGADHVFGNNVASLTGAKLTTEPELVLQAVGRMDDLPAFAGRDTIKTDLTTRAQLQEQLFSERDAGHAEYNKLQSAAVRLVVESAHALAATKAALDGRFTRQRAYVSSFFYDVAGERSPKKGEPGGEGGEGGSGAGK